MKKGKKKIKNNSFKTEVKHKNHIVSFLSIRQQNIGNFIKDMTPKVL